jgi:hypothetical protein
MTMIKAITATAMANPIIPKLAEAKTPKYPKITPEIKGAPALYMAEASPPATKKKAQPTKAGQVKMAIRGETKVHIPASTAILRARPNNFMVTHLSFINKHLYIDVLATKVL